MMISLYLSLCVSLSLSLSLSAARGYFQLRLSLSFYLCGSDVTALYLGLYMFPCPGAHLSPYPHYPISSQT